MLLHSDAVSISFMIKSMFVMDGNIVLKIRGKSINLDDLGVKTSTKRLIHFYIKHIIRVVDALQLCCCKKLSNEECLSFTNTVHVNGVENDNYDICYRSPKCQQIISWYNIKNNQMSRKCQKRYFLWETENSNIVWANTTRNLHVCSKYMHHEYW